MSSCIAIIPARGGSKRIPRKNIKNFLGKSMISYSIEAAINSKVFSEVMVSTDDTEIAELSKSLGAKVPILRSEENSNDYATTHAVVDEVLQYYKSEGKTFDYTCCLYATAPFVTDHILQKAYKELINEGSDSLIPVVEFNYPIQRAFILKDNRLDWREPSHANSRSQDLEKCYHDVGQFYFAKTKFLEENKSFLGDKTYPFKVSSLISQDIDTEEDWALAEMKFKILKESKS